MRQSHILKWIFIWVAASVTIGDAKNIFSKILMKKSKETEDQVVEKKLCVSPETLQTSNDQLKAAEGERDILLQERYVLSEEVKRLREEMRQQKEEAQLKLEQLSHASESAESIYKIQEEYTTRLAEIREQSARELNDAKVLIQHRDQELEKLRSDFDYNVELQRKILNKSVEENERKWKEILAIKEAESLAQTRDMQIKLENFSGPLNQEIAKLTGEKETLQKQYDKLEIKYENILGDHSAKLKEHLEKNLDAEAEKVAAKIVNKAKEEWNVLENSYKEKIQNITDEFKTFEESSLATIAEWKANNTKLEEDTAIQIEALKTEITKLEEDKARQIEELKIEMVTMNETNLEIVKKWEEDYNELNELTTKTIQKWKSDYKELEKSSAEKLKSEKEKLKQFKDKTERELKATVKELKAEKEKEIEDWKQKHEEIKGAAKEKSRSLDLTSGKLQQMQSKFEASAKDASYWENVYQQRSYINFTYIIDGVLDYTQKTKINLHSKAEEMASPYIEKSNVFYETHLKDHIDTIAKYTDPIYDTHISPHVTMVGEAYEALKEKAAKYAHDALKEIVSQYNYACPSVISNLNDIEKGTGLQLQVATVENSCRYPEETVVASLQVIAFILLVTLRRKIWGLIRLILLTLISIVWFFCPLRFFFSKRKPAKEETIPHETIDATKKTQ